MELPEQERFTINDLTKRWEKPESYILSIADSLEFRIELSGLFCIMFLEFDGEKYIENDPIPKMLTHLDFQFTTTEIRGHYNPGGSRGPKKMKTLNRKVLGEPGLWAMTVIDKYPVIIQLSAIYIPAKSVLAIEKHSAHRLVVDRLAAHLNKNDKITKEEFGKWVNEEYPEIRPSIAKPLFTFLRLPL
jgi:hypothetical protein